MFKNIKQKTCDEIKTNCQSSFIFHTYFKKEFNKLKINAKKIIFNINNQLK